MKIGELVKLSGSSIQTIHYYEKSNCYLLLSEGDFFLYNKPFSSIYS